MKQRKRVSRRRTQRTVSRLRASADGEEGRLTRWQEMRRQFKTNKKRITLYLDADVVAWFKRAGPRYQTRINRALWKVMKEEKTKLGEWD
jgi:uncharacterized protein (DUF4415 family)